mmetsp:Transcript_37252/g.60569  ORF Transcript_37252/g.60569 Transcript_37252/m.60569 type:complete len:80 (-) Transcript_37252:184-423(-)
MFLSSFSSSEVAALPTTPSRSSSLQSQCVAMMEETLRRPRRCRFSWLCPVFVSKAFRLAPLLGLFDKRRRLILVNQLTS